MVREGRAPLLQLRQEGQGLISAPKEVDQKGGVEDGHQRSTALILADRSSIDPLALAKSGFLGFIDGIPCPGAL